MITGKRHILGNIKYESRLTHGWTGSNDYEIAFLKSAGKCIQFGKPGRKPGNALLVLKFFIDFFQCMLHRFPDRDEITLSFILGYFQNAPFCIIDNILHRFAFAVRIVSNGTSRINQMTEF